ncbi:MAG TPA: pitrilysin family protein [Mycobacteriales bacterium]|nr:pitrilysin family protein [Mycobacteriales bacterium]
MLSESVPGARSVAYGVWIGVGSRDERPSLAGASHFLEHLLFKGTETRDALEIAEVMDAVGGESNAFTGKEYTCFYARVLDEDLPLAVDVVTDQVLHSVIDDDDVESEREVVLEEIAMHDDDPSDVVHDTFSTALFGDTPLGRPVIGSVESVEGLSRSAVRRWYRSRYALPSMVVVAAGSVDHARLLRLVRKAFGPLLDGDADPAPPRAPARPPAARRAVEVLDRPCEQANVLLGTTALARQDPRRPALQVLNTALGGGTSSRLFQTIREDRGLAYSVYSSVSSYADTGTFGVYAGCAPAKVGEVLGLVREVLADVAAHGLTDAEVRRAKGALKGSFVLDLEDTGSRMSRLGKAALLSTDLLTADDVLDRFAGVTVDDVRAVAADVLTRPMALGAIGPFGDDDLSEAVR